MKISELPSATTPLTGAELVELSQSMVSRKVTLAQMLSTPITRMSPLIIDSEPATSSVIEFRTAGVLDSRIEGLVGGRIRFSDEANQGIANFYTDFIEFNFVTAHYGGLIDIIGKGGAQTQVGVTIYDETYATAKGRSYWDKPSGEMVLDRVGGATLFLGATGSKFDTPVGFNNAAPVAKPTVTGSRAGNAALASLLTALAATGILTDSTTA
jgi:hypothetical protein